MFTHYRTEGVVIKKIARGEADLLLIVYTKEFGRVEVMARGARKIASKLRPAIEFPAVIEIEFIQGKTCKTLTDAVIINLLGGIRDDLGKSVVLRQMGDFCERVIKDQQEDGRIWNLISSAFAFIGAAPSKGCEAVYHYFVWHLLEAAGWRPDLGEARPGGRPEFDPQAVKAEDLALVKFFRDSDIERSARMKLASRQNNLLTETAEKYLAQVTG